MLSIFRTNQIFTSVLLIFYILILRVSVFIVPFDLETGNMGIWSANVLEWIGQGSIWANIVAFALLLIQAIIINAIVANHRLSNEVNLFPGLLLILISSLFPEFLHLSPLLMANTFLIIAFGELFETYKVPACADRIFNAGFWIGIASLFYFSYLVFILLGLIGLGILRAFHLRERLNLIFGALVPYILVGTYYFWFDQYDTFLTQQFSSNFAWLNFNISLGEKGNLLKIVVFSLILVMILLTSAGYKYKKVIQVQKKVDILLIGVLVAICSFIFQSGVLINHLLILAVPAGILISFNFTDMKKQWAESIHFIVLVSVLAYQYKALLVG